MMTSFSIESQIFSRLLTTAGINMDALRKLVDSANRSLELNAALTHASELNDLTIRVAINNELPSIGAGAVFDYASLTLANGGRMAIILDPSWLIGPNATLAASSVATRAGVLAVFGHELDHYMRVDTFRNLDQFQNPGYRPELTGEERFELYATQRMQAEVQGWYAGLRTYRTEIAGSASANLSALDTRRLTAVERLLLNVEAQGRQLGLSGPALESFVGERGAAVLSRNSTYWDTYVDAMRSVPGINADVVRQRLAYRLDQSFESTTEIIPAPDGAGELASTPDEPLDPVAGIFLHHLLRKYASGDSLSSFAPRLTDGKPGALKERACHCIAVGWRRVHEQRRRCPTNDSTLRVKA